MKARSLVIFFALLISKLAAQIPSGAHPEMVAAHLNTTFFLAGETLYFQIFCLDRNTGKLSSLSKIAYVELVGSDSKPLTQLKVRLDQGTGYGDFFFDGNVPSGNYTFIAYTRWMQNFGDENVFRLPITVVNPQQRSSPDTRASAALQEQSTSPVGHSISGFAMQMNKNTFTTRELVALELKSSDSVAAILSVSVRAAEPELRVTDPWSMTALAGDGPEQPLKYIPDYRSEQLTGTIRDPKNDKPLSGRLVTLSSPSKNYAFAVSTTDASGRYYFNLPALEGPLLLLGIPGQSTKDFEINHDNGFRTSYAMFAPPVFKPDSTLIPLIARRYLPMQIENAFYSAKRDSSLATENRAKFYSSEEKRYRLDDFTRFATMDDVFRELIPEVVVKIREGSYSLVMVNSATGFRFENGPLILIDGIPVSNPNSVMKYDPGLIKSIGLVTQRYYFGGLQANGIISIETFNGDAQDLDVQDFFAVNYIAPQSPKIYYTPHYTSDSSLSRVPDFRTQLFWKPGLKLEAGSASFVTFFTGDLTGMHVVEIVGVNSRGEKIRLRREFEVIDSPVKN